jgi:coenzyme F420 hydrogenase subunit beta
MAPETITYLEFRADYHVELRFTDGRKREIPFLQLPISQLPRISSRSPAAPAWTTPTCWPTSRWATWAAKGEQWLLVRNERGEELLEACWAMKITSSTPGSAGKRAGAVKGFLANTARAAGGLPLRAMPDWLRPIIGWLMPRIGPRGLEFARARVEMKAVETRAAS